MEATSRPLEVFRTAYAEALASALTQLEPPVELSPAKLAQMLRVPDGDHGDLAFPCFELSKQLRIAPPEIAALLEDKVQHEYFSKIAAVGPYLNASFDDQTLFKNTVEPLRSPDADRIGRGQGKTVVIDFSSPNIAKPLAFHHIRSTVIGSALSRIFAADGWNVVGINYLGDWGKQFGLLATGFERHGDPAKRGDANHLVEVYVKANKDANVAGVKSQMDAPEQARTLIEELKKLREEKEPNKKIKKKIASAEKKLRSFGKLNKDQDPVACQSEWVPKLEVEAEEAKGRLPEVEARDLAAREFLKSMEAGDEEPIKLWKEFRKTSIHEFETVYARMGVEFTHIEGESFYNGALEEILDAVRSSPGTRESEGAEVVDMDYAKGEPPAILKTRDGTTLYVTRDIAAARDRQTRFNFDLALYVVAKDQSLHFTQLFRALEGMGHDWARSLEHTHFGRVHGMSTRKGNVVFLSDVLDEACAKAKEICANSEKIDQSRIEETSSAIGVGAVIFGDLVNLRESDYNFDWDKVLDFSGFSGPYIQFSHARAASILRKSEEQLSDEVDLCKLNLREERALTLALARFPDAIAEAVDRREPSIVSRSLLDISQRAASYFTAGNQDRSKRVLCEDKETKTARLHLVDATKNALFLGLTLLGIKAPDAM